MIQKMQGISQIIGHESAGFAVDKRERRGVFGGWDAVIVRACMLKLKTKSQNLRGCSKS